MSAARVLLSLGHVDGYDDCGYLRVAYNSVATSIVPDAKGPPREAGSPGA